MYLKKNMYIKEEKKLFFSHITLFCEILLTLSLIET